MSVRAGIVITGTEVLTGRVRDRNGPWLSDRLLELGVELAHITICGDRPKDMQAQLSFLASEGVDLIVTSGGLGPTADDLTLEVVARFAGRPLELDPDLEQRIADILEPLMKRWPNLDFEAVRASNRKQALVPEGATIIEPAGTAPGMVVPPRDGSGPTFVVLPGPPRELHSMWHEARLTDAFQAAVSGATAYRQEMLRLFGIPESEIAVTLREARDQIAGFDELEITTCLRRGEIEVVVRLDPSGGDSWEKLRDFIAGRHADTLFSADGSTVDRQVADLLMEKGWQVATAESCTGGLMAARLTEPLGASGYVAGGAVTYSNEAKVELLGVPAELIAAHGAVSPQVAEAMAAGALRRFGAGAAVAITGIAGPAGGTEDKPVGTVCWCAMGAEGAVIARTVRLPGDRNEIRDRSTTVGMHLLRRLLGGEVRRRDRSAGFRAVSGGDGPRPVRLFLALALPDEARASIARWRDEVLASRSELRPVADQGLHVTLVFLGQRPSEEVQRIWELTVAALAGCEAPGLGLASATWIPPRRPRLLAVELSDEGRRAASVHGALSAALAEEGLYQPERRPFWPHVTVARARGRAKVRKAQLAAPPELAFTAGQVTLYRSDLHPSGSRYVPLERLALPVAAG